MRAREHKEALQQRLGAVEILAQARVERLGLWRHAVGLGDRDVQPCAHHRQRGTQLVRGVGDEPPLRFERGLEAREQLVDRVRELPQLIARAEEREPLVQALLGDPPGPGGDRPQRCQHPAGDHPAQRDRERGHRRQRDRRLDQQLVQINAVLVTQCGPDPADLDRALSSPQPPSEWTAREDPTWRPVTGAVADEQVGDHQQTRSAEHEQAAVERGQAKAHAPRRQAAALEPPNQLAGQPHLRPEDAGRRHNNRVTASVALVLCAPRYNRPAHDQAEREERRHEDTQAPRPPRRDRPCRNGLRADDRRRGGLKQANGPVAQRSDPSL